MCFILSLGAETSISPGRFTCTLEAQFPYQFHFLCKHAYGEQRRYPECIKPALHLARGRDT